MAWQRSAHNSIFFGFNGGQKEQRLIICVRVLLPQTSEQSYHPPHRHSFTALRSTPTPCNPRASSGAPCCVALLLRSTRIKNIRITQQRCAAVSVVASSRGQKTDLRPSVFLQVDRVVGCELQQAVIKAEGELLMNERLRQQGADLVQVGFDCKPRTAHQPHSSCQYKLVPHYKASTTKLRRHTCAFESEDAPMRTLGWPPKPVRISPAC